MLTADEIRKIEDIVSKGNTAEVKKNKDGILVLEVIKRIKKR